VIVHIAWARSSVPYHLDVPPSYGDDEAVASVEGKRSESSALFDGSERTAIALFRPASANENESSFSLLTPTDREFDVV
jgi:hypothetical protein